MRRRFSGFILISLMILKVFPVKIPLPSLQRANLN
jgi:hypothetical protein